MIEKNLRLSLRSFSNKIVTKYLHSSTQRRIASGTLWGIAGTAATRVVTVILSFILARILGKEGFGEYGIINSTSAMIGSLAGLGLGSTVTRYIADLKIRDPIRASRIVGLSTIITWISATIYGIAFVFLAPWLAEKTLAAPKLTSLLQISSITIAFGVVNSVQMAALYGIESFKTSSILNAILGIVQSVTVVLLAFLYGLKGAVIALAICSGINVVAYYIVSRKELHRFGISHVYNGIWKETQVLVSYSLPAFLGTILVGPTLWASNTFLAKQPGGYGELGIFTAALQWDTFIQFFPLLISNASFPVMSEMYGNGEERGSINLMWKMMKITAIIVIPLAIIISMFSSLLIKLYGPTFKGGQWVIVIVVITTVFSTISAQLGTFIAASGKMWIGFGLNAVWAVTFVLLSFYMVKYGAEGLAGAKLIAYFLHFIWSLFICLNLSKVLKVQRII